MVNVNVRFPNLADTPRIEVAYAALPFTEGEWNGSTPLMLLDDANRPVDACIEAFGARWPDGSVRYGKLLARVSLAAGQTKTYRVTDGQSPHQQPFEFHPAVIASTNGAINFVIKKDGIWHAVAFGSNLIIIEDTRLRRVFRSRLRIGDFVVDLKLYVASRQQMIKFELCVTGSNPANVDFTYPFDEMRLMVDGANTYINIRGLQRRGVKVVTLYKDYKLLSGPDYLGDGQKQCWYGEIMPSLNTVDSSQMANALAANQHALYGMSTDWTAKQVYASLGATQTPEAVSVSAQWQQMINQYNQYSAFMRNNGDPWDDYPLGLTKTPGQTGSVEDFGCLEGGGIIHLGAAELLDMVLFMASEESKRPVHFYETNATEFKAINHPSMVSWNGRPHWDRNVSPDKLGKTNPDFGGYSRGWVGKDWEHFSSNILSLGVLMTGSYMLLDEVHNEIELYLSGHTLPSVKPGWSTNQRFAARGFGRTHHMMCNHYLITNRQDLLTRMIARFRESVMPFWDGATRSPVKNWAHLRDNRVLGDTIDAWVPWNESLGFVGAVALYNVTHLPEVKALLVAWGDTIVKYGWRPTVVDGVMNYVGIGQGVEWFNDGHALTEGDYWNGRSFIDASDLKTWGLPVLKVAGDNPALFTHSALARQYLQILSRGVATIAFPESGQWKAIKLM